MHGVLDPVFGPVSLLTGTISWFNHNLRSEQGGENRILPPPALLLEKQFLIILIIFLSSLIILSS